MIKFETARIDFFKWRFHFLCFLDSLWKLGGKHVQEVTDEQIVSCILSEKRWILLRLEKKNRIAEIW